MKVGRVQEAEAEFHAALRLEPDLIQAHQNLAVLLQQRGRSQEAVAVRRRIVELQPNDLDARRSLGVTLQMAGAAQEAAGEYRAVLRERPDDAQALNNLAWLLVSEPAVRDPVEALRLARLAEAAGGGSDAEILDTLAAALAATGDVAGAIDVAERALAIARAAGNDALARTIEASLAEYRRQPP